MKKSESRQTKSGADAAAVPVLQEVPYQSQWWPHNPTKYLCLSGPPQRHPHTPSRFFDERGREGRRERKEEGKEELGPGGTLGFWAEQFRLAVPRAEQGTLGIHRNGAKAGTGSILHSNRKDLKQPRNRMDIQSKDSPSSPSCPQPSKG